MEYITVDLDKPSRMDIVKAWYRVQRMSGSTDTRGRVSSGGYGVHIRSHPYRTREVNVCETQRVHAGDDVTRVYGDADDDLCMNQVFFDSKGDKEAGPWTDDLDQLIQRFKRSVVKLPELDTPYL